MWCEGVGMLLIYRLRSTGWSIQPAPPHPACHDDMTWASGRTLQTSDPKGMMRWCGLGRTGNLGSLACKGGQWSKRYRRRWSPRGKPPLLVSFRQSSWLIIKRGRPTARTCYAWVETQNARLPSARAGLLHIGFCLIGSSQIVYQPYPAN